MKLIQRVKIAHTDALFCVKNISFYHLSTYKYREDIFILPGETFAVEVEVQEGRGFVG